MGSWHEWRMARKREHEKEIVGLMVGMYCHRHHGTQRGELCPDCWALLDYARERVDQCPRIEEKTFCSSCPIHCYSPARSQQIRTVMRWAGPRMIFRHPLMALRHLVIQKMGRPNKDQKK
jgi:hypothetical protein